MGAIQSLLQEGDSSLRPTRFHQQKTTESARSVIPPEQESVNLDVAHQLSGLASQVDALNEQQAHVTTAMSTAMNAISSNQRAFNASGAPTHIQTENTGNASALGSDTLMEAQCRRLLNEQQINMGKQMDAMALKNQELLAKFPSTIKIGLNKETKLYFDLNQISLFDANSESRI